ncbi:TPA: molecular chaperone [Salmonella enterica]|nr:molecular chaperone [Salmonella enterica]EDN6661535.1 molecular chaperone [Salmonella enterica]EKQ1727751.1 molecular chaperone [Salmonella enterica]HAK8631631.1 molecular chaperone [Salmonella enterica]
MLINRSTLKFSVGLFLLLVCLFASSLFISSARAEDKGGFSLGATRVIYDGSKKEATITVINSAKNAPFLAQSWVTEYAPDKKNPAMAPFLVTPPLYRQDQGKNTLRIIRTGGQMPSDRESVYWLNVKAIPAAHENLKGKNTLQFAYVLRVKLFWRPAGLAGNSSDVARNLNFSRQGNTLTVHNSGPYYVTFNELSVGGRDVKDASSHMVPPKGEQRYTLPAGATGNRVSFRTLNDFGGVLPAQTVTF